MSFINSYSSIVSFVNQKIADIDNLSKTDAALVAAMAQLLNGRNNPIASMPALLDWLQTQENDVQANSVVKEVTLLLGAAMGSKNTVWRMQDYKTPGSYTFTVPDNVAGNVLFVTGCGGGPSGRVAIYNASNTQVNATAAWSACLVENVPVQVSAGQSITVVVGAGGDPISVTIGNGSQLSGANSGQISSFGDLIFNEGALAFGGWGPPTQSIAAPNRTTSTKYLSGQISIAGTAPTQLIATGSPPAPFSNGVDGVAVADLYSATGNDAQDGTGGAGGAVTLRKPDGAGDPATATSGKGGGGRVVVRWQEFV